MKHGWIECELFEVFEGIELNGELSQSRVLRYVEDGQVRAKTQLLWQTQQVIFL
jgi:hypothetical protein